MDVNENSPGPDIESQRSEMIANCDKYLHDFGLQIRAADRHSSKIQRLLSSADKLKLFKIDEEAHTLFLLVLKGKTNLMKAKTVEQLQSTFNKLTAEVHERDRHLKSTRVTASDKLCVDQSTKDLMRYMENCLIR